MSTTKELLESMEKRARATLDAMPELYEAESTLTGIERAEAMIRIGAKYGLDANI